MFCMELDIDRYRVNLAKAVLCLGKGSTAGKIPIESYRLAYCSRKKSS